MAKYEEASEKVRKKEKHFLIALLFTLAGGGVVALACCVDKNPEDFIILTRYHVDATGNVVSRPHGEVLTRTPQGYLENFNKSKNLNPACFSDDDYMVRIFEEPPKPDTSGKNYVVEIPTADGIATKLTREMPQGYHAGYVGKRPAGNLWAMDLNWKNTEIIFMDVDKSGRFTSIDIDHVPVNNPFASKASLVKWELQHILGPYNGSGFTGEIKKAVNEYKAVQSILSALHGPFNQGRPPPDQIGLQGFNIRNLSDNVERETPYDDTFDNTDVTTNGVYQGKVYFYVLLDTNIVFQKEYSAVVPRTVASNNAVGQKYTPFIQYPVYPGNGDSRTTNYAEVLTFHVYQDARLMNADNLYGDDYDGQNIECAYPFDIAVVADAQLHTPVTTTIPQTPLLIDPVSKPRGILQ